VQFNKSFTQEVQSVVKGGRDTGARSTGALDYSLSLGLMRIQIIPGALVQLKAETRFGRSVNVSSGAVLPVNADAFFPITQPADEDIPITITMLSYMPFLAPTFGLMVGQFDTLDGDFNEFASGRGKTQFMKANFLFNAATALRMPYSTLGGGLIWMPIPDGPGGGASPAGGCSRNWLGGMSFLVRSRSRSRGDWPALCGPAGPGLAPRGPSGARGPRWSPRGGPPGPR
jgi:porin